MLHFPVAKEEEESEGAAKKARLNPVEGTEGSSTEPVAVVTVTAVAAKPAAPAEKEKDDEGQVCVAFSMYIYFKCQCIYF